MDGTADGAAPTAEPAASRARELARALGVSLDGARRLLDGGHDTPEAARAVAPAELAQLGLSTADREAIARGPSVDPQQIVDRWVGSVGKGERPRRPKAPATGRASADLLRRWVDGDDRAMEEWIRASDPPPPLAGGPGGAAALGEAPTVSRPGEPGPPSTVSDREETVVRWLTGLLDRVKSEQFDPASMIQEVQELQRQLYDERARRKQLEDQVEHVKRGSIAVIKYVRSREAKEREEAARAQTEEVERLRARLSALEVRGQAPRLALEVDDPPTEFGLPLDVLLLPAGELLAQPTLELR